MHLCNLYNNVVDVLDTFIILSFYDNFNTISKCTVITLSLCLSYNTKHLTYKQSVIMLCFYNNYNCISSCTIIILRFSYNYNTLDLFVTELSLCSNIYNTNVHYHVILSIIVIITSISSLL